MEDLIELIKARLGDLEALKFNVNGEVQGKFFVLVESRMPWSCSLVQK